MDKGSRVFFLGAGASADAGFPLTRSLLAEIGQRIANARDRRSIQLADFITTFGLDGKGSERSAHRPPIVDAIGLIDTCLREGRPLHGKLDLAEIRQLRNTLTVELAQLFFSYGKRRGQPLRIPEDARDQPGAIELRLAKYYRDFVAHLQLRERTEVNAPGARDSVITTNYDINADLALFERAYDEATDLKDVYLGAEFREPYEGKPAFYDPGGTVDLLKLHGSLNWLYCPRCSRIFVAAFAHTVLYLVSLKKNAIERKCFCGYYSLEPVLIAPSVLQDIVNPHLVNIWMAAYEALESAVEWIFVGYSLPSEDLAIRSLLYRAIDGMRAVHGRQPTVEVICPVEDRVNMASVYGPFFDPIHVTYTTQRFAKYVEGMGIEEHGESARS